MKKSLLTLLFCIVAFYNVNAQYKLNENFTSATFPPTGWTRGPALDDAGSGLPIWTRSDANAFGIAGTGSAYCNFYDWSTGTDSLTSPIFTAASGTDTLYFDNAYKTYQTEVDDLKIFTSTNGGANWTLLIDLPGGPTIGTGMVTAAPSTSKYTNPLSNEWVTRKYLPGPGVNRIKFQVTTGFGNNLYIDNVKVGVPPSADAGIVSLGSTGTIFVTSGSGTANQSATVQNNGNSSASFSITRTIRSGGSPVYTNTQVVASLPSNNTFTVNYTPFNYTSNVNYTVKDSINYPGDTNPANDTLSASLIYTTPKTTLIINLDSKSRDSLVTHLNKLDLNGTYDQTTTFPGVGLNNWRTLFVVFGSSGVWPGNLRDSMKAYLDNASNPSAKRSLIIFGNDLGYAFDPRSAGYSNNPADSVFYRQYLHAQYWSDNWNVNFPTADSTIKGTVSPFTSISAQRINDPFPDCVAPATWNTGSGTLIPAFIPVTESGNGDSCTAVAYSGQFYNVFYGSNVYANYVPTVTGLTSPQGNVLTSIRAFVEINLGALPVELASFNSVIENRNVTLKWTTASEQNNAGFDIERKTSSENTWVKTGNVQGSGNSNSLKNYSFSDKNMNTGRYNYRLKQIDFNGNYKYYDLSNEVIIGIPVRYNVSQNYPNPFNPSTKINYDLPFDSKVDIKLFDIAGREVANIVNTVQTAGYYTVSFNASSLSSGAYFYQINAVGGNQNFVKTLKMVLIK